MAMQIKTTYWKRKTFGEDKETPVHVELDERLGKNDALDFLFMDILLREHFRHLGDGATSTQSEELNHYLHCHEFEKFMEAFIASMSAGNEERLLCMLRMISQDVFMTIHNLKCSHEAIKASKFSSMDEILGEIA